MHPSYTHQRDTFKLVEKLASKDFPNPIALLKSLVKDIVSYKEFEITGGRIWELDPSNKTYNLIYQVGNVKKIPTGYSIPINEHPILSKLVKQGTVLNTETDKLLRKKGITTYSLTGVGEIVKVKSQRYYKYALGFNAPEILQSFYETLNIINSVANIALKNLSTLTKQKKIQKDILKASEIQNSLLPDNQYNFHDYNLYGKCKPTSFVGGDYFDYIYHSIEEEERLIVLVSDAATHGLPAAIQSLFLSGAIRLGSMFSLTMSKFLNKLNTLVFEKFPYERFVTLFYCQLTLSSNRLVLYSNAGHCPPIHYRPSTDTFQTLDSTGGFLGLMENQKFGVENIRMHKDDILLLYTDGITEARNIEDELFGEERLKEIIKINHGSSPKAITKKIFDAVNKFTKNSNFEDDQTVVVIKRDKEEKKALK